MKKWGVNVFFIHVLFLIFYQTGFLLSQSSAADFMPLQIGNVWVYQCNAIGGYCYCIKKFKISITGTEIHNNRTYFTTETFVYTQTCWNGNCSAPIYSLIRVDSSTATLYYYTGIPGGCSYSPGEQMIDSFQARLGDTVRINCADPNSNYRCIDTSSSVYFGSVREARSYSAGQFEIFSGKKYVMGIGPVNIYFVSAVCNTNTNLFGSIINGVLYGDTSTVLGIKPISSEVPEKFELYQNYPNPFNPKTKIRFSLPNPSKGGAYDVRLIVYDVLGREVASLIPPLRGGQEGLSPGTYEVEWDGSSFVSGVYFYQLITGDFIETKKMILIR